MTTSSRAVAPGSALLAGLPFILLALPAPAQNVCPVTRPGAAGLQAAVDACAAKGGGVAYVPPGEHVSGPIWLKDGVELRLEAGAVVRMSHDKSDWPPGVR